MASFTEEYKSDNESDTTASSGNEYIDSSLQHNSIMVLCIEERDTPKEYSKIDSRLFIFWNLEENTYTLYGRRQEDKNYSGVPYCFNFENSKDVLDFVRLVIQNRLCSLTYYNYNNIYTTDDTKKLNYEFFEDNMDRNYEIIAYDRIKINYSILKRDIRLLRSSSN